MKYVSEVTNKMYATVEELKADEAKYAAKQAEQKKLKENRAARAKEVEEAIDHARDLMDAFLKDYGSFYSTVKTPFTLFDLFM